MGRVVEIHSPVEKLIAGKPSRLMDFLIEDTELTKENTPMKSISTNSMVSQTTDLRDFISGSVVITTISELYQQTESGDFYVPAMITGIESSGEWYYISCKTTGCNKKLKFENGLLYCEKCDRKWQNGTQIVLYSRSVKEVVDVPTELESLIGKAMVFKLFGVIKILNDENIVAAYCSSFGVDQEKDLISKMLEDYGNEYSEDGVMKVNSPNNIIKPRQQEVEQEMSPLSKRSLLDQFSSTQQMKKGRLEVIKKEKIV
nr:replication protein A 70 kDa DNA-binding subunit-like [Ipomoea batatas]